SLPQYYGHAWLRVTCRLAALRIAAIETRHAAIHHDDRGSAALAAELRPLGEMRLRKGVRMLRTRLELRPLLVHQLLLVLIELRVAHETDGLQVPLDDVAQLRDDRWHEFATRLPVPAARVEHGLQLIHQERHVAALAEHRRNDPRQRDDPLEVIEVLRVDEDLEGPALLVFRALVQHDVVDGHVHRMIRDRRLDLVGRADEYLRTLDLLVHPDDLRRATVLVANDLLGRLCRRNLPRLGRSCGRLILGLLHVVLHDLAIDLDGHDEISRKVGARTV